MLKRLFYLLAGVLLMAGTAPPSWAALQTVGPISGPHGYPQFYTDTNNLSLELCLEEGWCFFDPVDTSDDNQVALGIGGEVFWWMGDAVAPVTVNSLATGGQARLVLGIEGTFGGAETVINGQQISFGRVRVRVDVPTDGTYTVLHPFGTLVFENVTVADGINYTADIGAANFFNVEAGFAGTLQSNIGPFLTWPGYQNDPALQVREAVLDALGLPVLDAQGNPVTKLVAQYVGDLNTPHIVTGSPIADTNHPSGFQNFFRVIGPNQEIIADTDLFGVMGKVYGDQAALLHVYPDQFEKKLAAVGPVNRLTDFGNNGSAANIIDPLFPAAGGFVADATEAGYPLGYPTYYQDATGLQLTICQGGNPMCISEPVNANIPVQKELATGGETFFWSADAVIEEAGVDALLVLGTEGTFGGSEALIDGQQITFGRTRINVDTPVAGNYTVIYPYGMKEFNNVPAGKDAIKFTADIGITDPADPDYAFVGALYSEIGPNFLTWTTFNADPALNDPLLIKQEPAADVNGLPLLDGLNQPIINEVHYVGDPAIAHAVQGGSFLYEGAPVNYFRVIGPNGIDVRTNDFVVSGRVYAPETFRAFALATVPVVNADVATTITTAPVTVDVLANDTLAGASIDPANVIVTRLTNATNGNAVLNVDKSFTYTANPGFAGTDTFTYVVAGPDVSNIATVSVTVQPAEVVAVNRAQLDRRKLRWDIRGTGNVTAEGNTVTVRLNSATGNVIGTTTVSGGSWKLNAIATTAPPTGIVQVYVVSSSGVPTFGPFNVQVR